MCALVREAQSGKPRTTERFTASWFVNYHDADCHDDDNGHDDDNDHDGASDHDDDNDLNDGHAMVTMMTMVLMMMTVMQMSIKMKCPVCPVIVSLMMVAIDTTACYRSCYTIIYNKMTRCTTR